MASPRKGGVSTRGETLAKELDLERYGFVFDRQPDAFLFMKNLKLRCKLFGSKSYIYLDQRHYPMPRRTSCRVELCFNDKKHWRFRFVPLFYVCLNRFFSQIWPILVCVRRCGRVGVKALLLDIFVCLFNRLL